MPEKLIVAHLGNGASISAIRNGKCLDTSMGLTPTGGIISGTRTGDIDPGVLLFILRKIAETAKSADAAADQLEVRRQQESRPARRERALQRHARTARRHRGRQRQGAPGRRQVHLDHRQVDRQLMSPSWAGSTCWSSPAASAKTTSPSRAEICAGLGALGIVLDPVRNNVRGPAIISAENSPVTVRVISAAEDLIIVNHVLRLMQE